MKHSEKVKLLLCKQQINIFQNLKIVKDNQKRVHANMPIKWFDCFEF